MSNRTLIEINHDYAHKIEGNQESFCRALGLYLNSGNRENADQLERYGVRVFGMRHHSDGFSIKWGAHKAEEKS